MLATMSDAHWTRDDDVALAVHRGLEALIAHAPMIEAQHVLLDVAAGRAAEAMRAFGAVLAKLPENLEEIAFDEIAFNEIMRSAWPSPRPWKRNARRFR